jgi:hypothetical protein
MCCEREKKLREPNQWKKMFRMVKSQAIGTTPKNKYNAQPFLFLMIAIQWPAFGFIKANSCARAVAALNEPC